MASNEWHHPETEIVHKKKSNLIYCHKVSIKEKINLMEAIKSSVTK